ncbi:MAG: hypothetical protein AAGC72_08150 [Planctomycetota bacterium]
MAKHQPKQKTRELRKISVKRQITLYSGLVASLFLVLAIGLLQMRRAHQQAQDAADSLMACRTLSAEILRLRKSPALIEDQPQQHEQLAQRIEGSAINAGISPEQIIRIWPQEPRRLEDTVYKDKATLVVLREVGLDQSTQMLHEMASGPGGVSVKSIRLTAPREQATASDPSRPSDTWNIEATVGYLIYAPIKTSTTP